MIIKLFLFHVTIKLILYTKFNLTSNLIIYLNEYVLYEFLNQNYYKKWKLFIKRSSMIFVS